MSRSALRRSSLYHCSALRCRPVRFDFGDLGAIGVHSVAEPRVPRIVASIAPVVAVIVRTIAVVVPAVAEAHTSLAFAQLFADWDWAASEAGFRRAIALDPGYATGHQWYAEYLTAMGRFDEALLEARAAEDLDALSYAMPTTLVNVFYYARRFDEALEYDRRMAAFALPPASLGGLSDRARILEQGGRAAEAVTEYRAVLERDDDPRVRAGLACALARAGRDR